MIFGQGHGHAAHRSMIFHRRLFAAVSAFLRRRGVIARYRRARLFCGSPAALGNAYQPICRLATRSLACLTLIYIASFPCSLAMNAFLHPVSHLCEWPALLSLANGFSCLGVPS